MAERVQEVLVDLAQRGLKVMFVARPDACRACRRMQGRVFEPREAPKLPLEECLTPPCRCRYEGYNPERVVSRLLSAGMNAVREERLEEARELLYQVIDLDERNERAWLWLSGVARGTDERIVCLEHVLAIDPHHRVAEEALRHLLGQRKQAGTRERTVGKIREARQAIAKIRLKEPKVATLREVPPPPSRGLVPILDRRPLSSHHGDENAARVVEVQPALVRFWVIFVSVLFAVVSLAVIVVLVLAAANVLR
jgi:hypothetical protein